MKNRAFRFSGLCLVLAASLVITCDPFHEDLIPPDKQITLSPSPTDYYILPNTSAVIYLKSIVSFSYTKATMKLTVNPTRGKLTSLSDFLLKYEPDKTFNEGTDQFKIAISSDGKVLKTVTLTLRMSQDVTGFPCSLYGVQDFALTKPDSAISIKFLANDRICGFTKSEIQASIYSKPKHGQASLAGDSIIIYTPESGFMGTDELVYKITAGSNFKTSADSVQLDSYGLISIGVSGACSLSLLENYYLDLTDDLDDPLITRACGTAYYAPFWTIFHNSCPWKWTSSSINWVSKTSHSGSFCIGPDGNLSYTPNLEILAINDTARVEICVNGNCKKVFFYVKSEEEITGKWSRQVLRGGLSTIFFVDENTGYAGGRIGLLKTTDGGQNWNELTAPPHNIYQMYFLDSDNGFIACTGGVMKTTNGGGAWDLLPFQDPVTSVFFTSLTVGFIGTSSDPGDVSSNKLYKTTDGGANWNLVLSENNIDAVRDINFANPETGYAHIFGDIIKTVDSGGDWQHSYSNTDVLGRTYACSSLAVTNSFIYAIFFSPGGGDFYIGSIWRSEDGAKWKSVGPGPVNTLAFSRSGDLGIAVGSGYAYGTPAIPPIYMSHDKGVSWTWEGHRGYQPVAVAVPSNRVAYLLCNGGVLLKYSDK